MIGCILPSGNRSEFRILEKELLRRGVRYLVIPLRAGGAAFLLEESDVHLLPKDEKGPYLGTDESGHSIYPLTVAMLHDL